MCEKSPSILPNHQIEPSSKMVAYMRKLREKQDRALAEKSKMWGFDFKQSAPAPPACQINTQCDEVKEPNFTWTPTK